MTVADSSSENNHDDRPWPPGFRFHPTDEELVLYYLKRKICRRRLRPDIIGEIDVHKWDPEELPGQSILKTRDRQWFFFSPRDRKYPNGTRSNRATIYGYWKATGKDRTIFCNSRTVGNKKTLVFYRGRAPSGERTDWVMHEYTIDDEELKRCQTAQDYYVLYKLYKKSGPGPKNGEQYGAPFNEDDWADDPLSTGPLMNDTTSVDNLENVIHLPFDEIDAVDNFISFDPPHVPFQSDALNASITQGASPNALDGELRCMEQALSQHVVQEITAPHLEQHIADQDYLEMNDLQPMGSVISPTEQNKDAVDQTGFDLFYDAEMFLRELGPVNHHEFNTDSFLNDFQDHSASELFQHHPPVGDTRQQRSTEDGTRADDESWFSSALWAFVESIPTSPASAAESVLKNKTMDRVPSFSRRKATVTEDHLPPLVERRDRFGRSLFRLSLLVTLFAIGLMMMYSRDVW